MWLLVSIVAYVMCFRDHLEKCVANVWLLVSIMAYVMCFRGHLEKCVAIGEHYGLCDVFPISF